MKIRIVLAFLICVFVVTPLLAQGPPNGSGVIVTHAEDFTGWTYVDESRGLVAIHGFNLCEYCGGEPPVELSLSDILSVLHTDKCADFWIPEWGIFLTFCVEHLVVRGDDQYTEVWDTGIFDLWPEEEPFPPAEFCEYVCNPDNAIGIGTARVHVNSNDWYGVSYDDSVKRAQTVNFSAQGTVIDAADNTWKFYGRLHAVAKGDRVKEDVKIILR